MIPNPRPGREDSQAKQEIRDQNKSDNNQEQISKPQSSTSNSSRQWTSAFRNPRIVRVSRSFGGKDRHSKVCTVRGLRDRRIRLSVPTAVQLYDLQDRLGLNQPSKVVDWLLEAAKEDVDKLPPLQFPQGFGRLYPNMMFGGHDLHQSWDNGSNLFDVNQSSTRQDLEIGGSSLRTRSYKEVERDGFGLEKGKWIKEGDDGEGNFSLGQSSKDKFYPAFINNPTMAFNPYHHHFNPSDLSLSQLGNNPYLPQSEVSINTNTPNPTMNNLLPSGSSQLIVCQPSSSTMVASVFPSYPSFVTAQLGDGNENVRQLNQYFQLSNSCNVRSFHQLMNVNPGFGDMQRNNDNRDNENNNNSDS